MSRVKDPQVILLGLIKQVGNPADKHEMVVVSLPPLVSQDGLKLVERTLLVNLPDQDQIGRARNHDMDSFGKPIYPTIRCYLKSHLFDDKARVFDDRSSDECANRRNGDPQTVIIGTVQPADNHHTMIVIDLHGENLFPAGGYLANTLLVNVPSLNDDSDEVLCYFKYRVIDESENARREEKIARREARLAPKRSYRTATA